MHQKQGIHVSSLASSDISWTCLAPGYVIYLRCQAHISQDQRRRRNVLIRFPRAQACFATLPGQKASCDLVVRPILLTLKNGGILKFCSDVHSPLQPSFSRQIEGMILSYFSPDFGPSLPQIGGHTRPQQTRVGTSQN